MDSHELASFLRSAVSKLHKGLRRQMSSANNYSMTELETIRHLFRSASLLPSELAALTKITTQSMSQVLSKLEGQGLIKRTPSKKDGRKVCISLTVFGKKMVEKTRYDCDEWLKGIIETSLTAKEKDLLERALPVINKLIEAK